MSEKFALYSSAYNLPPKEHMMKLSPNITPQIVTIDNTLTYIYKWEDNLSVVCSIMPKNQISNHLQGFYQYIQKIGSNNFNKINALTKTLKKTSLIIGIEITPRRDPQERAENIIGSLCYGLKPIIFHEGSIFNYNSELIFAPNITVPPTY